MDSTRIELISVVQSRLKGHAHSSNNKTHGMASINELNAPSSELADLNLVFHKAPSELPPLTDNCWVISNADSIPQGRHLKLRCGSLWALIDAIIYSWLTEFDALPIDEVFVERHVYGFGAVTRCSTPDCPPPLTEAESYRGYLLGWPDATPKTPEWARKVTGLESSDIRALAAELAKAEHPRFQCASDGENASKYWQLLPLLKGQYTSNSWSAD
ncbi:hypothetical protein [Ferrimonas marina]|uniref:Uncharacterized protein n=1 Tax=Ferrimonas marina TaxID=299255 RepID=A0A1M5X5V3_9GAMM|nr:hypothetical protein [Ferrimonas marina]SHH94583.1 hypothetical protein SAMN02745129_3211 [Ferrimonas marina]